MDPGQILLAVVIAAVLSLVIAIIEIERESKTDLEDCLIAPSLVYWIVLCFGNVITTLLATTVVGQLPTGLATYHFLFAPFFGVFGFEVILKNTNVTMFDRGVLTIQDWIQKALVGAAAAAILRQQVRKQIREGQAITKLMQLSEQEITTRILHKSGRDVVVQLDADAAAIGADAKLYKALYLASHLSGSEVQALLSGR